MNEETKTTIEIGKMYYQFGKPSGWDSKIGTQGAYYPIIICKNRKAAEDLDALSKKGIETPGWKRFLSLYPDTVVNMPAHRLPFHVELMESSQEEIEQYLGSK